MNFPVLEVHLHVTDIPNHPPSWSMNSLEVLVYLDKEIVCWQAFAKCESF